jgi:hypothetical protein
MYTSTKQGSKVVIILFKILVICSRCLFLKPLIVADVFINALTEIRSLGTVRSNKCHTTGFRASGIGRDSS